MKAMTNGVAEFNVRVPDSIEAGVYANLLSIWHTAYESTLDFSVSLPVEQTEEPVGIVIPARVVARVKVPPTIVFDMIRAIGETLTGYESLFGSIRRPGNTDPLPFPDDLVG